MKRIGAVAIIAVLLTACGGSKTYDARDLPTLVLTKDQAPKDMVYDDADSGPQTLDEFARTDATKKENFAGAGFQTSYFAQFVAPSLQTGNTPTRGAAAVVSFAILFDTPDDAVRGLRVLQEDIRRRGTDVTDRPDPGLGDASFAMHGTLRPGLPSGYVLAWRLKNAAFGVLALGEVDERGVGALAKLMLDRET